MHRPLRSAVLALVLLAAPLGGAAADQQAGRPDSPEATHRLLADGIAKWLSGSPAASVASLKAAEASPAFASLPPVERHIAYSYLGTALLENKDAAGALRYLKLSSEAPDGNLADWQLRLGAASTSRDVPEQADALTGIARRWPSTLTQRNDRYIQSMFFQLSHQPERHEMTVALARSLHDAHWAPLSPFRDNDDMLILLIQEDLLNGNTADAVAVIHELVSPFSLFALSVDNRFSALSEPPFSPARLNERLEDWLRKLRSDSNARPMELEGKVAIAHILFHLNRPSEALALLDSSIQAATPPSGQSSPFKDRDEQITWALNYRSTVLVNLGRYDEALSQLKDASLLSENGRPNVSQVVNLGDLYDDLARPDDALKAVAGMQEENASPFGLIQLANVRACAYAQLADRAKLDDTLAYMKAHVSLSRGAYEHALLCANDLDAAAQDFIQELQEPTTRLSALFEAQSFVTPPNMPLFAKAVYERMKNMMARPDVTAVIAKIGRVESVPFLQ